MQIYIDLSWFIFWRYHLSDWNQHWCMQSRKIEHFTVFRALSVIVLLFFLVRCCKRDWFYDWTSHLRHNKSAVIAISGRTLCAGFTSRRTNYEFYEITITGGGDDNDDGCVVDKHHKNEWCKRITERQYTTIECGGGRRWNKI